MNMNITLPDALRHDQFLLRPGQTLLKDGPAADLGIVVSAGRFHRIGPAREILTEFPHLKAVDLPDHLLMPGLIDAHTHLTQSMGKALAFGEPSEIFRRIWVPVQHFFHNREVVRRQVQHRCAVLPAVVDRFFKCIKRSFIDGG